MHGRKGEALAGPRLREMPPGGPVQAFVPRGLPCSGPAGAQSQKEDMLLLLTFPTPVPKSPRLDILSGSISTLGLTTGGSSRAPPHLVLGQWNYFQKWFFFSCADTFKVLAHRR